MKIIHIDENHPILLESLNEIGHQNIIAYKLSKKKISSIIAEFDGIVIRSRFNIDKNFISKTKNLNFIARVGSGLENIDVDAAKEKGIILLSAPEGNSNAVGEHAIGMLLSMLNKIRAAHNSIQNGNWLREQHRGYEINGKVIGIIGYGNTGRSFAKKLKGFQVKVIFHDIQPFGNDIFAKQVSLKEIQNKSDIISLHVPENKQSINMINKKFIQKMKKPFWLVNTSRGKIIVTKDLIWGIKNNYILGAGLDVLEYESSSFEKIYSTKEKDFSFLLKSNKVLLTPHIAGWTFESHRKLAEIIIKKISKLKNTHSSNTN
ncbi:MAG: NAD(P)-dependent oxidoreductase [Flavobacteriaceae bacterium]|nr:NAD(P)-dependent oxidoreductase [Flavobacteriaceae bacterium]